MPGKNSSRLQRLASELASKPNSWSVPSDIVHASVGALYPRQQKELPRITLMDAIDASNDRVVSSCLKRHVSKNLIAIMAERSANTGSIAHIGAASVQSSTTVTHANTFRHQFTKTGSPQNLLIYPGATTIPDADY